MRPRGMPSSRMKLRPWYYITRNRQPTRAAEKVEAMRDEVELADRNAIADYLEDLADRVAVLESRADPRPGIPWEQIKAENGL
jgi:hypothetical protein